MRNKIYNIIFNEFNLIDIEGYLLEFLNLVLYYGLVWILNIILRETFYKGSIF